MARHPVRRSAARDWVSPYGEDALARYKVASVLVGGGVALALYYLLKAAFPKK